MTGNTLIEVRVNASHDMPKYLRLKALGYVTRWVGEGFICLGKIVPTATIDTELAKLD